MPRGECRPPEERLGSASLAAGGERCPRLAGGSVPPAAGLALRPLYRVLLRNG